MSENDRGGFSYEVSDEQIRAYAALPIDRRVRWVEELARTTYALATPVVRARWAALRRGDAIGSSARPTHRDAEFAAPFLPEPHFVLTVALPHHDEVLEIWEGHFVPLVVPLSATIAAWLDGTDRPSEWRGDALVLAEPSELALALASSASGEDRLRARLVAFLEMATDVRADVRIRRA